MEFRAALEQVRFGLLKVAKDSATLDHIARTARGNQVVWILLPLVRPRNDEIYGHYEGVLEVGHTVQPTVLATVPIPFENPISFFRRQRLRQTAQTWKALNWHTAPPKTATGLLCSWTSAKGRDNGINAISQAIGGPVSDAIARKDKISALWRAASSNISRILRN
jgi:hypothetical protein